MCILNGVIIIINSKWKPLYMLKDNLGLRYIYIYIYVCVCQMLIVFINDYG